MAWRTSYNFVYFLAGFTAMATFTMLILILVRPFLGDSPPVTVRYLAMYAPLFTGLTFGWRVRHVGKSRDLPLGRALKAAVRFQSGSENS